MKERISRRAAIFTLAKFAAAGLISIKLGSTLESLATPEEENVSPEKLVPFIEKAGDYYVPEIDESGERIDLNFGINKELFAQAILEVAAFDGKVTPQRIYSLLEKRPLKISMTREAPSEYLYEGRVVTENARYQKYLLGGPEITFFENAILSYQKTVDNFSFPSLSLRYVNDIGIYHEIAHLIQDLENPIKYLQKVLVEGTHRPIFRLEGYNYWNEPTEVDAVSVAEKIALAKLKTYSGQISDYPFGNFLTFS